MAGIPWNKGKSTKELGKSRPVTKLEIRDCLECGIEVKTYPSQNKKYCSLSCRSIYNCRLNPKIGEDSPAWKGGYSVEKHRERARFSRTVGREVLQRDGNKCVKCGSGGYLHVDHIKKWSEFPELRFDPTNCQTLCVPCHYFVTYNRLMPKTSTWGLSRQKATA